MLVVISPAKRLDWEARDLEMTAPAMQDDAVRLANATEYGLSAAVFSKDEGRALKVAKRIQSGVCHINDQPVNDSPFSPFGGVKNSGVGRFNGHWAVEAFTTTRWISVQHDKRSYPFSAKDL